MMVKPPKKYAYDMHITLAVTALALLSICLLFTFSSREHSSPSDVRMVLSRVGFDPFQKYSLLYGFESLPNLWGERDAYYCIQLSDLDARAFEKAGWKQGPPTDPVVGEAIEIARDLGQSKQCFAEDSVPSWKGKSRVLWSIDTFRGKPSAAELLFFEKASGRLLYVSYT